MLIDESGTLPDPDDKFVVVAGVTVRKIKEGHNLISRTLESLRRDNDKIREIKFYYSGKRTRRRMLSAIASADIGIFMLIVDKKDRKIADSPENFALLVAELINEIFLWGAEKNFKVLIDKHFHKKSDEQQFDNRLKRLIKETVDYDLRHIDSQKEQIINLADFIAGASLTKHNRDNPYFYNFIKESILLEKIVNWPELKKKSIEKQKISRTGASTHPRDSV